MQRNQIITSQEEEIKKKLEVCNSIFAKHGLSNPATQDISIFLKCLVSGTAHQGLTIGEWLTITDNMTEATREAFCLVRDRVDKAQVTHNLPATLLHHLDYQTNPPPREAEPYYTLPMPKVGALLEERRIGIETPHIRRVNEILQKHRESRNDIPPLAIPELKRMGIPPPVKKIIEKAVTVDKVSEFRRRIVNENYPSELDIMDLLASVETEQYKSLVEYADSLKVPSEASIAPPQAYDSSALMKVNEMHSLPGRLQFATSGKIGPPHMPLQMVIGEIGGIFIISVDTTVQRCHGNIAKLVLRLFGMEAQASKDGPSRNRRVVDRKIDQHKKMRKFSYAFEENRTKVSRERPGPLAPHVQRTLDLSVMAFQSDLERHGYSSTNMSKLPKQLFTIVLQHYIQGYGIHNFYKLKRMNEANIKLFGAPLSKLQPPAQHPEPDTMGRRIIVKAWKELVSKDGVGRDMELQAGKNPSGDFFSNLFTEKKEETKTFTGDLKAQQPRPKEKEKEPSLGPIDSQLVSTIQTVMGQTAIKDGVSSLATLAAKAAIPAMKDEIGKAFSEFKDMVVAYVKPYIPIVSAFLAFILVVGLLRSFMEIGVLIKILQFVVKATNFMGFDFDEEKVASDMVAQGLGDSLELGSFFDFRKYLHETARTTVSLKNITEFVKTSVATAKEMIDFAYEMYAGRPWFEDSLAAHNSCQAFAKLFAETGQLDPGVATSDPERARTFCKMYMQLKDYSQKLKLAKSDSHAINRVDKLLMSATPMFQSFIATLCKPGGRMQPVWINLYGPAGQGKTVLLNSLCVALYTKIKQRRWSESNKYNRNQAEAFWSKYEHQFLTLYDDLFQIKDPTERARTAYELINVVSPAAYSCDMPDVASKGITFFDSEFVISTSNLLNHSAYSNIGIVDSEAFFRRMEFDVKVTLKEKKPHNITVLGPSSPEWSNYNLEITHRQGKELAQPEKPTAAEFINMIIKAHASAKEAQVRAENCADEWYDSLGEKNSSSTQETVKPYKFDGKRHYLNDEVLFSGDDDALPLLEESHYYTKEFNVPKVVIPGMKSEGIWDAISYRARSTKAWWHARRCDGTVIEHCRQHGASESVQRLLGTIFMQHKPVCPEWVLANAYFPIFHPEDAATIYNLCTMDKNREVISNYDVWKANPFVKGSGRLKYVIRELGRDSLPIALQDWVLREGIGSSTRISGVFPDIPTVLSIEDRKLLSTYYYGTDQFFRKKLEIDRMPGGIDSYTRLVKNVVKVSDSEYDYAYYSVVGGHTDYTATISEMDGMVGRLIQSFFYMSMIAAIVTGLVFLFGAVGATPNGFSAQSEDKNMKKGQNRSLRKMRVEPGKGMVAQSSDTTAMDISQKILANSLIWVTLYWDGFPKQEGFLLLMKGGEAVINYHVWTGLKINGQVKEPCRVVASYSRDDKEVDLQVYQVRHEKERDLTFVKFAHTPSKPDLTKYLPSKADIPQTIMSPVLCSINEKGDPYHVFGTEAEYHKVIHIESENIDWEGVYVVKGLISRAGDCTSPYVSHNVNDQKKLKGIHGAGSARMSQTTMLPLYSEDFLPEKWVGVPIRSPAHMVSDMQLQGVYMIDMIESEPFAHKVVSVEAGPPKGTFIEGGAPRCTFKDIQFSTPQHTKIVPTMLVTGSVHPPLAPPWEVKEQPARLKPGYKGAEYRDPNILAYRKYSKLHLPSMPKEALNTMVYEGIFTPDVVAKKHYIVTIEQAVFGMPEIGMAGIDLSTSSGFPWAAKGYTRKDLINPKTRWIHPELRREVEFIISEALAGRIVPHFTLHCLKDETRPIERVFDFYTRAFQIGALAHLIASRCSLMTLLAAVEHGQEGEVKVGVNPYGGDWDMIALLLERFTKFTDQDVSGYEYCFPYWFPNLFCQAMSLLLNKPINSDYIMLAWAVTNSSVHAYVVYKDTAYEMIMMISGSLFTAFGNSASNSAKTRIQFIRLSSENQPGIAMKFEQHVQAIKYGDDDVIGFDDSISEWFNGQTLAASAKEMFNHTHTAPDKSDNIPKWRRLSEIEFLKRGFKHVGGSFYTVAPLNKDSIKNMLQWIMKPTECSMARQFQINTEVALFEACYHGPEFFEEILRVVNAFNIAYQLPPSRLSYEHCWYVQSLHKM